MLFCSLLNNSKKACTSNNDEYKPLIRFKQMSVLVVLRALLLLLLGRVLCDNQVKIDSAAKLKDVSANVNSGTTYEGTTVTLTADIDFDGVTGFEPIGTYDNSFKGVFDGQGYVIRNFKMSSSSEYVGLFGYIRDTEIKNVVMDSSCSVSYTGTSSRPVYIGGVVGYQTAFDKNSLVENIVNLAPISFDGTIPGNSFYMGGIGGYFYGFKYFIVKNCANYGTITSYTSCEGSYMGGLVGYFLGSTSYYEFVYNCFNFGSIVQNTKTSSYSYIGGIGGRINSAPIANSVAIGTTEVPYMDSNNAVYGLAGSIESAEHCFCSNYNETLSVCDDKDTSSTINASSQLITSLNASLVKSLNNRTESEEGWCKWTLSCSTQGFKCVRNDGNSDGFRVKTQLLLIPAGMTCTPEGQVISEPSSSSATPPSTESSSSSSVTLPPPLTESSSSSIIPPPVTESSSSSATPPPTESSSSSVIPPVIGSSSSSEQSLLESSSGEEPPHSSSGKASSTPTPVLSSSSLPDKSGSESKHKGISGDGGGKLSVLAIVLIVLFLLILIVVILLIAFFVYVRNTRRKEEDGVPLGSIKDRRRVLTDIGEDTSRMATGSTASTMAGIYPEGYTKPNMRSALLEAGLTEEQADKICAACTAVSERAKKEGKLFEGFTEDDAAAIAMYTYDFGSDNFESNPYRLINRSLSSNDPTQITKIRGILCLVMVALRKLPRVSNKILYRGLRRGVSLDEDHYCEGNTIAWAALTSTSPDLKATKAFLARWTSTGKAAGTLFVIEDSWGYDIQPYSLFPGKAEIIIEPGHQFTVKSVIDAEGITIVTLSMVDSPGIQQDAWK